MDTPISFSAMLFAQRVKWHDFLKKLSARIETSRPVLSLVIYGRAESLKAMAVDNGP